MVASRISHVCLGRVECAIALTPQRRDPARNLLRPCYSRRTMPCADAKTGWRSVPARYSTTQCDLAERRNAGMPTKITMPQLGESVSEGTVGRWLKNEGDTVKRDEVLVEIVTDKVTAEYPSPVSGRLVKILAKEDETVKVGAEIAEIEETGASSAAASSPTSTATSAASAATSSSAAAPAA